MKWAKFNNEVFVEATNTLYSPGQVAEVSDAFAKRHGKEGTGSLELTSKPQNELVQDKVTEAVQLEEK